MKPMELSRTNPIYNFTQVYKKIKTDYLFQAQMLFCMGNFLSPEQTMICMSEYTEQNTIGDHTLDSTLSSNCVKTSST